MRFIRLFTAKNGTHKYSGSYDYFHSGEERASCVLLVDDN